MYTYIINQSIAKRNHHLFHSSLINHHIVLTFHIPYPPWLPHDTPVSLHSGLIRDRRNIHHSASKALAWSNCRLSYRCNIGKCLATSLNVSWICSVSSRFPLFATGFRRIRRAVGSLFDAERARFGDGDWVRWRSRVSYIPYNLCGTLRRLRSYLRDSDMRLADGCRRI